MSPAPTDGRSRGPGGPRSGAAARDQLLTLLGPVVAGTGCDLEDVSVSSAGRRSVVRVIVDSDGGVTLDDVAAVSRAVSDALDSDSPGGAAFAGPYVLEVSSPGVDRPLSEPRHWRRALGRRVSTTVAGVQIVGRIADVSDHGVRIVTDPGSAGAAELDPHGHGVDVAFDSLGRGRVQVEFDRDAADPHDAENGGA